MQAKSTSCQRCIKNNPHLAPKQQLPETIKKPESYLAKKFQELYDEDRKLREKKGKKMSQYRAQKQKDQLQYCTFQPKVNSNDDYFISNSSFLKRQVEWKSSVEKKIAAKRELEENNNKKKYTFKPKISTFPNPALGKSTSEKSSQALNYTQKRADNVKKSYRNIHTDRKKLQQITKSVIIEPFKHRKQNQTLSNSLNYQSITLSKTMTTNSQSSPFKNQKNMLIVEANEENDQKNPEESQLTFDHDLDIKKVSEYDLTQSKQSNFSEQIESPVKHIPHSTKRTILKFNSIESVPGETEAVGAEQVDEQLHSLANEHSSDGVVEHQEGNSQECEEEQIF